MKKRFFIGILVVGILCCFVLPAFATEPVEENAVTITGELVILHVDDFDKGSSKVFYELKDIKTQKTFYLHFGKEPPGKLRTGAIVTVRGKAKDHDFYLEADTGGQQIETVVPSTATVAGEQKTIVLVADFLDDSVVCSVSDIRDRMFADPLNKSVDDFYQEMSFGQVWFTGDVAGPYVINYTTTSECNIGTWSDAAEAAAMANGIDLSVYNRKIYVLPRNNPCGYVGVGTVGGNPSQAWIFRCDGSDVIAHELGHNLGMNHASTPTSEYGDTSDIMGYSGFGLRQINAPHQDQMGWLDPQQISGVVESGIYTIAPIELNSWEALAPQILMIAKPDTGESYYLSYRQAIGFDYNLSPTYWKGANIHRYKTDSATRTYLLKVLADGENFTDTINGVTITQLEHINQYVTVQIQIANSAVCTSNAPTISISPISQSALAGSILSYTVNVTNMDSTDCWQSTFSLNRSIPTGWSGSITPTILTLAPGGAGGAMLSVTSPNNAGAGDYALNVQASDGIVPIHTASRDAAYTVLSPPPLCIPANPVVSISPVSQSGQAGATLVYSVSVSNADSAECQPTTYSITSSLQASWNGILSPGTLTLVPGGTGITTLSVTSPDSASSGDYAFNVSVSDVLNSSHAASRSAVYSILRDTTPPTAPAGLTASYTRKKIMLLWTASTDNTGVAGYKIWRNNVIIGETAATTFSDYSITKEQGYTYFVTAFDAAGNVSASSNQAVVTFVAPGKARKK